MIKAKRKPLNGLFYDIGVQGEPKGVIWVRFNGKTHRLMLLHDYLVYKNITKHSLLQLQQEKQKRIITSIAGRSRFGYFVDIDSQEVPSVISDKQGVFELRVGSRFRSAQFIDQYKTAQGYASKALVQWKLRQGRDGLQTAVLNRYASEQNILFVLLPFKKKQK